MTQHNFKNHFVGEQLDPIPIRNTFLLYSALTKILIPHMRECRKKVLTSTSWRNQLYILNEFVYKPSLLFFAKNENNGGKNLIQVYLSPEGLTGYTVLTLYSDYGCYEVNKKASYLRSAAMDIILFGHEKKFFISYLALELAYVFISVP